MRWPEDDAFLLRDTDAVDYDSDDAELLDDASPVDRAAVEVGLGQGRGPGTGLPAPWTGGFGVQKWVTVLQQVFLGTAAACAAPSL